jgi:hypothetical protein
MSIKVNITFGGLCMFVQCLEEERKGLWVLLPDMSSTPETNAMNHCAMMVVSDPAATTKHTLHAIAGTDLDLTPNGAAAPVAPLDTKYLFTASKYAGNDGVAADCFESSMPKKLIARFRLPLSTTVGAVTGPNGEGVGEVLVEHTGPVKTVGSAIASFTLNTTSLSIPVKGNGGSPAVLAASASGSVELLIVNAPRTHLDYAQGTRFKHFAGEMLMHTSGYFSLLRSYVTGDMHPEVRSLYNVGDTKTPPGARCPIGPEAFSRPAGADALSIAFIEPINCSVGHGCPTDDPC